MKKILFLFLFYGTISQLTAQVVFSKVYDLEQHMDLAANIFPIDSILISTGAADNFLMGPDGFGVLATDLFGNKIWSFNIDGFETIRLNTSTSDENFVYVAINDLRGITPEEKIIRIASDGTYDFFEPYQTYSVFLENPTIWHLYKTPTGFMAGITETLENPIRRRNSIIEYDENFIPQSWIVYKEPTEFYLSRRVIFDPTGGYAATLNINTFLNEVQAVKKFDAAGNTLWTYELPNSYFLFIESPIRINQAGETLVAYIEDKYNPVTEIRETYTMLTKLDPEGAVLWETKLSDENLILVQNMFLTENEDIILTGRKPYPPVEQTQGAVTRIDQEGNIIWERVYSDDRYGGIDYCELNNGFEMENGDLVFAGTMFDTINNIPLAHQDFWLLRVGLDGCYIPDCDDYNEITPVEEPSLLVESQYFLTPTIASNHIKIQTKLEEWTPTSLSISVINISGQRMVTKEEQSLPYQLEIIDYPSGFYFVTIRNNAGQIQTLKFVKP